MIALSENALAFRLIISCSKLTRWVRNKLEIEVVGHSTCFVLFCLVPAEIVNGSSAHDVTAQEGDSVLLTCNATGIPQPHVTWYRRESIGTGKFLRHLSPSRKYLMRRIPVGDVDT